MHSQATTTCWLFKNTNRGLEKHDSKDNELRKAQFKRYHTLFSKEKRETGRGRGLQRKFRVANKLRLVPICSCSLISLHESYVRSWQQMSLRVMRSSTCSWSDDQFKVLSCGLGSSSYGWRQHWVAPWLLRFWNLAWRKFVKQNTFTSLQWRPFKGWRLVGLRASQKDNLKLNFVAEIKTWGNWRSKGGKGWGSRNSWSSIQLRGPQPQRCWSIWPGSTKKIWKTQKLRIDRLVMSFCSSILWSREHLHLCYHFLNWTAQRFQLKRMSEIAKATIQGA